MEPVSRITGTKEHRVTLRKWNASRVIYLNVFILVLLVTFVVIVETVDRRILDLCILGGRVFRFMEVYCCERKIEMHLLAGK